MAAFKLETGRLQLRWLDFDDATFVLELVNDPDWIRFIGDKRVHNLDDARGYIETEPLAMYRRFGFGLNRVALKSDDSAIGICGLLKRDEIPDIELGFALLPDFRGRGYAEECAGAVLEAAFGDGITRVLALVHPQNEASRRLLLRLGFHNSGQYCRPGQELALDLYVIES